MVKGKSGFQMGQSSQVKIKYQIHIVCLVV